MSGDRALSPGGVARLRSRLYLLLASAFFRPTPETLRRLGNDGTRQAARALARAVSLPSLEASVASLGSRRDPARVPGALRREYQRLFVGPYHLEAPPYESCYRDGTGAVMGEAAVHARGRYAEAGFALHPEVHDLPDHIAFELSFLGLLAREEARLWRTGGGADLAACLRREEHFLADHLAGWVGPFSERVRRADRSRFYARLAVATATFVMTDVALVGALREAVP